MKKRYLIMILCILCLLGGCGNEQDIQKGFVVKGNGTYVYGLDSTGHQLIALDYTIESISKKDQIAELLEALRELPVQEGYRSALPGEIALKSATIEGTALHLDFNAVYNKLDNFTEVLCRAACVRTLVQIKGIEQVLITVDGQLIVNANGKEIGLMTADSFVDNSSASIHKYESVTLQLYFAGETGEKLKKCSREILYDTNVPIEKAVVLELLKGPGEGEGTAVIPANTKLISVSVREGICYVNFDEGFLDNGLGAPELAIYSVVDSVLESSQAAQVQILVNGEAQGSHYSRNLDVIEQ